MARRGRLYTFGYSRVRSREALTKLLGDKVTTVVDIRLNRYSYHAGFSTRTQETVQGAGYEYLWANGLGNAEYKTGGLRIAAPEEIVEVTDLLEAGEDVALMCVCATPDTCHRRAVSELVKERLPEVQVVDL